MGAGGISIWQLFIVIILIAVPVFLITRWFARYLDTRTLAHGVSKPTEKTLDDHLEQGPGRPKQPHRGTGSDDNGEFVDWGSGFLIAGGEYAVTNNHVIEKAKKVIVENQFFTTDAQVILRDERNDLALLKLKEKPACSPATIRPIAAQLGEQILVVGYPLSQLLGTGLKVTDGVISGTSGIKEDSTMCQITAAIQPGNSGGPLLDKSGHVVGVVSQKLNELAIAESIGTLPQNVNFAIKSSTLEMFLQNANVSSSNQESHQTTSEDVAKSARQFAVRIRCLG